MATNVGDLVVRLLGNTADFEKSMEKVDAKLKKLGTKMRSVGKGLTFGLTTPLLGVGVAASKMAMDLDTTMSRVVGLVGLPREEVAKWREEILQLAPAMGKSAGELGEALFFITSAGIRGTRVMEAVKAAAMGAAAGLGDTAVVADAATSAMNAYASSNMSAEMATAILVATVREGKAEASSLAPVLGAIMPIAANLGVSFDQVGASLAAMTRLGFDASIAATSLRATLAQIAKPANDQIDALKGFGLTFEGLRETIREKGLMEGLLQLKSAFGENEEAMTRVFPNIRALSGVLALLGENTEATRGIFERMAATTTDDLTKAFEAVEETAGFKLQQALTQLKVLLLKIGDDILPLIVPKIEQLADKLEELTTKWQQLEPSTKSWIMALSGIAIVVGPALMAIGLMAQGIGALVGAGGAVAGMFSAGGVFAGASGVVSALNVSFGAAVATSAAFTAAVVALAAAVGVLIGTAIRPWINELLELNEAFGLIANKNADITDGLVESQDAWDGAYQTYESLRKTLELSGSEWEVVNRKTRTNAERLQMLTDKVIALNRHTKDLAATEQQVADVHAQQLNNRLKADAQVAQAMENLNREEAAHLDALKEKYEVLSKDDIAQQMEDIAADFNDLKDTVDKTQLAEKFNEPMLKLAKLAAENKVAIPKPFQEAASHLGDKLIPGLDKLIQQTHTFDNDFTLTGKKIDGIFWSSGETAAKALEGGFQKGVARGVEHGKVAMDAFVKRIEDTVIYIPVQPNLEGWNEAVHDAMEGRVPDTTG